MAAQLHRKAFRAFALAVFAALFAVLLAAAFPVLRLRQTAQAKP